MNSQFTRVAITGIGAVTALGDSAHQTFTRLAAGEQGISAIAEHDITNLPVAIAAEIKGLRVSDVVPNGRQGIYSRADALALIAVQEALQQSKLGATECFLASGTTGGGVREAMPWLMNPAAMPLDPAITQKLMAYPLFATADRLCECIPTIRHSATFCSACSSSATAIIQAALWLQRGQCECAVAGGTESLSLLTLMGFAALGAIASAPCRPFDSARSGMSLGEGAAYLVLESERHALQRNAEVLAWLDGFSLGAEAYHITHPEPSGQVAARLISQALGRAGVAPSMVSYFNAHGTGTVPNDSMEARALRVVFGDLEMQPLVSTVKGQLGHTLGAAGAIEAAMTILAMNHGVAPPTVGLSTAGEDTALNHVIGSARTMSCKHALSSSFGFGGLGAVLAFAHVDSSCAATADEPHRVVISAALSLHDDSHVIPAGGTPEEEDHENQSAMRLSADPLLQLDPERSRRFDRLAALACGGIDRALQSANVDPSHAGLLVGNAMGNVKRLSASMTRVKARGVRGMAPVEFPQLVHSSMAANASIYHGLHGPVLTVSDPGLCGGVAVDCASSLLACGLAEVMVVGAVEAYDDGAILTQDPYAASRSEIARPGEVSDWFVLETEQHARLCNRVPLARIVESRVNVGNWAQLLRDLGPPTSPTDACLLIYGLKAAAVDRVAKLSGWWGVRRIELPAQSAVVSGTSSAVLLMASRCIHQRQYREVTAISKSRQRAWCFRLVRADETG